tara:strand:+ start:1810 stop:1926 length:117 start_codon:yes stop_codon:yes gene_type:complete
MDLYDYIRSFIKQFWKKKPEYLDLDECDLDEPLLIEVD